MLDPVISQIIVIRKIYFVFIFLFFRILTGFFLLVIFNVYFLFGLFLIHFFIILILLVYSIVDFFVELRDLLALDFLKDSLIDMIL